MVAFTGGDKLAAKLRELSTKVTKSASVQIGFLEGATYPDGTSVPMVAAIQEFGAPGVGIPPRLYFRSMIAAKSPEWGDAIADLLTATDFDATKTLTQTGEQIKLQLQESIINTNEPPLSPITVMLRGMKSNNPNLVVTAATVGEAAARVKAGKTNYGASTKVLDDSGRMLGAVDYVVKS